MGYIVILEILPCVPDGLEKGLVGSEEAAGIPV